MLVQIGLTLTAAGIVAALDNGFGRTPVMGFNTYNQVGCSPNASHVETTIEALAAKGFPELGYRYFQVDCGWQGYELLANGSITYDAAAFPHGILALSRLAQSKGFKWAMYTDQGAYACDTRSDKLRPGSLGHESQDAHMLAAWGTEYMKVDNCYIEDATQNAPKDPRSDFPARFGAMSDALRDVGIDGMLVCQWGVPYAAPTGLQGPATWTPQLANSFRVSDDIAPGWANVQRILNEAIHVNLAGDSAPGRFSDMDLLEVGNAGMTEAEQASHFAVWAMFKSALMVSTDVVGMSDATFSIVSNKGLIDINQDALGAPVKLVQRFTGLYDVFAGPLQNGDMAVLLLEQSGSPQTLSIDFADLTVESADAADLWTRQQANQVSSFSGHVEAHGSLALRLSNVSSSTSPPSRTVKYIDAASGRLAGSANVQPCSGCSSGSKVGNIGQGATLTLQGITVGSTAVTLRFDYVNCQVGYLADGGLNVRGASVSVNGGAPQDVHFPLTGYDWDRDVVRDFRVRLDGFQAGSSSNTVAISWLQGVSEYAPDIDRVGFEQ